MKTTIKAEAPTARVAYRKLQGLERFGYLVKVLALNAQEEKPRTLTTLASTYNVSLTTISKIKSGASKEWPAYSKLSGIDYSLALFHKAGDSRIGAVHKLKLKEAKALLDAGSISAETYDLLTEAAQLTLNKLQKMSAQERKNHSNKILGGL